MKLKEVPGFVLYLFCKPALMAWEYQQNLDTIKQMEFNARMLEYEKSKEDQAVTKSPKCANCPFKNAKPSNEE